MIEWLKNNYVLVIIVLVYSMTFITIPIVLWETFTGQSIVDKIWNLFQRR